jgi:hypothetical protein
MIHLFNCFIQKFIITSPLEEEVCVDTYKRRWYNDKVVSHAYFDYHCLVYIENEVLRSVSVCVMFMECVYTDCYQCLWNLCAV